jgi:hypothetical protein
VSVDDLAGGGWIAIAAFAVVAFGKFVALFARFVAAVATLADAAKAWFVTEAKVQTSTLEHHARVKERLESEDEEERVFVLVDRAAQA